VSRHRDDILDHEADGIREFDNDLPRWWLYGFYLTILFAAAYLVNYHVLPRPIVGPAGMVAEYEAEMAAAGATKGPSAPAAAIAAALTDADSLAKGQALFANAGQLCTSCHRPDLGGLVGPNLTDDQWLHGCSAAEVVQSIKAGYPARGMLPYGGGPRLDDPQVLQLASYILSRRGSNPPAPKPADAAREKTCS
jgi:cytochrome c oxidase cbb3-type subunit III